MFANVQIDDDVAIRFDKANIDGNGMGIARRQSSIRSIGPSTPRKHSFADEDV